MSAAPAPFRDVGPMGQFFAAKDWAQTTLGDPSTWSPVLRGYVDMILRMPEPAIIFWGPELLQIYNAGYSHIMGPRHPEFLGRTLKDCWPDTYDTVIPLMSDALVGKVVEIKDALIPVTRFGFTEETYFTFSFVPLRNSAGEVEGLIQPINEVTKEVIARRRLATVTELSPRIAQVRDAIAAASAAFTAAASDIPFALVYTFHADRFERCAAVGVSRDTGPLAALAREVALTRQPHLIEDVTTYLPDEHLGPWPEPARRAMVLPLERSEEAGPLGALVLGISSRLVYDETYRTFFESCARELASNLTYERDNRRRDELTAELHRRAEALTELDRAKTAFFSNVSHEFRTPLTLILGPIDDVLEDDGRVLALEHRRRLEVARRSGHRLFKLVNSLLDFSRIEAQKAQAKLAPVNLSELTADLASSFRSLVEGAGMRLVVDCPPLSRSVRVDREMWEKIVLNLLSNAFKFTFEGEIRVELRERVDRQVEVRVVDTGVGIPRESLDKVFERFHRVETTRGRSYEGTGIGLALVRELVTLHEGTITVDSVEGAGTTFTITLPASDAEPAQEARIADRDEVAHGGSTTSTAYVQEVESWTEGPLVPAAEPPANAPLILLADDNHDMRSYVTRLLSPRYRVSAVTNGAEALERIAGERPDLVLTDVMMPVLDGFGLLARIREDPATRALPVILLSARAGEESRVEGLAAGADDYLAKPFPARELLARVAARLEIAQVHAGMNAVLEGRVVARTAQLQEVNRELESFSYTVSHDLRAPLRHILGFAQLLERSLNERGWNDRARQHLRTITEAAQRGGQLVDDLLAFSRLGRAELRKQRVDLNAIVAETRTEMVSELEGRTITWRVSRLPEVSADPGLLRLVVRNLLSNAIKYTRQVRDAVIEVRAVDVNGEQAIQVTDNGIGFDMRYVDKLFRVFQRLHSEEQFEGTGIGLAHVRRIVMRHGGRIWAEGSPGQGATFTFTLSGA